MKSAKLTEFIESGEPAILIKFPHDNDTLAFVKTIPNRKYYAPKNYWTCPLTIAAINILKKAGFQLDEKLEVYLYSNNDIHSNIKKINIPGLKGELMPFQNTGVSIIDKWNGNALLADEMGLGKTIETLAYLQLRSNLRPVIVVVPACVKLNWAKEAHTWLTWTKIQILSGETPSDDIYGNLIIINYNILHFWLKKLLALNAQVLIADECHYFMNSEATRTKDIKRLAKFIPHKIFLSGTPIKNRPKEIYNAWKILDPINCPNYIDFCYRYCDRKFDGFKWDDNGASNTIELYNKLINSVMIRRLKKDVLPELPDKIYSHIPMELTNQQEYKFAENDFIEYVRHMRGNKAATKASNAKTLTQIESLKQLAVMGKINQVIEWIDNFLSSDQKLVVYAHHKIVIDTLMKEFKFAKKIDGSITSLVKRRQIEDNFQTNPETKLLFISEAGGLGINLTAASHIAILELPWGPSDVDQIIDRLHRVGQKMCVNIYYLLAAGTIEEKIAKIIDTKRKVSKAVLNGEQMIAADMLQELIRQYSLN